MTVRRRGTLGPPVVALDLRRLAVPCLVGLLAVGSRRASSGSRRHGPADRPASRAPDPAGQSSTIASGALLAVPGGRRSTRISRPAAPRWRCAWPGRRTDRSWTPPRCRSGPSTGSGLRGLPQPAASLLRSDPRAPATSCWSPGGEPAARFEQRGGPGGRGRCGRRGPRSGRAVTSLKGTVSARGRCWASSVIAGQLAARGISRRPTSGRVSPRRSARPVTRSRSPTGWVAPWPEAAGFVEADERHLAPAVPPVRRQLARSAPQRRHDVPMKRVSHTLTYPDTTVDDVYAMLADPAYRKAVADYQEVVDFSCDVSTDRRARHAACASSRRTAPTASRRSPSSWSATRSGSCRRRLVLALGGRHPRHHPRQARRHDRHDDADPVRRRRRPADRPRRQGRASPWSAARSRTSSPASSARPSTPRTRSA